LQISKNFFGAKISVKKKKSTAVAIDLINKK
jgi:hypothetical protein